ncbi:MAG: hypothetical protein JO264_12745 [Acidisphaera sp.]|nr:hypothetical protein [Acidisphaera sp.]
MTLLEAQQSAKAAEEGARKMAAEVKARAIKDDSEMGGLSADRQLLTIPDTQSPEMNARRSATIDADIATLLVRRAEAEKTKSRAKTWKSAFGLLGHSCVEF